MTVRKMLQLGDFNYMSQEVHQGKPMLVILTKRGDPHIYKLWVKGLYSPQEIVVKEEITEV